MSEMKCKRHANIQNIKISIYASAGQSFIRRGFLATSTHSAMRTAKASVETTAKESTDGGCGRIDKYDCCKQGSTTILTPGVLE